ncbi:MAG: extracellular solute-binding protein [Leptotrichiaceae bacterium]|nr:extracellular solute-binding protein [Leptotrichiaceae bacterium]
MKQKWMLLLSLLSLVFLMSCGGKEEGKTGEEGKKSGNETLVVYSNSLSDGRGEWLKEKAKEAGFELEFVEAGGGEITNRLIAEKNNPIADIVFGPNQMDFSNLKKESLLEQYVPKWAAEVTEGLNDKDGYYHAIVKQAIVMVYGLNQYDENNAPKDWLDLPANFKGKYEVPSTLGNGTTRVVISGILTRYRDANGDLGISEEGWKAIGEYFKNGVPSVKGEDLFSKIADKKVGMGQIWSSGIAGREEQYKVKVGIVRPEVGVPFVIEGFGIVKGTKKLEKAKAFVEWFGSPEIQAAWSKQFTSMPANTKALAMADPKMIEFEKSFTKKQDIDWEFVSENINKWIEKIELQILQ